MEEESNDICSQINMLSSIQRQQKELSKLAKQLQSEKDREKYIKVIEMSKIIQAKLDHLQTEKNIKSIQVNTSGRVNSFGQGLNKKNSTWSLNNRSSSRSSSSHHTSNSSVTTTASSSRCSSSCGDNQQEDFPLVFSDSSLFPSSYRNHHQTFHGHTYRIIDKVTSLQFQHQQPLDSVYNNRRCSAETILSVKKENDKKNQIVYMKPTPVIRKPTNKKRQISFSPLPPKCDTEDDDNESEEEYYTNTTIHVAVRRDASLFKIEKVSKNPLGTAILRPVNNHNDTITAEVQQQEQQQCTEKQDKKEDVGLPTPPNSPQDVYSDTSKERISSESDLDLNTLPQIIHVHKKSHQSLKGLLKRSYQLNQYTITKTNSTTLTPESNNLLFKTVNATSGKPKLLLKVVIVSLTSVQRTSDKQKRFGFTFWWQTTTEQRQQQQDESSAKFALAPDSLVKEALATWIDSQDEHSKGAVLLPSLSRSDEILRDGRKIYVIYDKSLFPV